MGYNGVVKITIPIPEKISLNKIYAGIHFRTRSRHKDAYRLAVQVMRPKPYTGPFPASCHYHFKLNGSRLDVSNHAYMVKMVEDGLVACGVLPDDDQKYIASIVVTTEYVPKGKGQNEVVVTLSQATE